MAENEDRAYTDKEILSAIDELVDRPDTPPVVTSARLASELGIERRTATRRLNKLANNDANLKRDNEGQENLYWRTEDERQNLIPEEERELFDEYVSEREIEPYEGLRELVDIGMDDISTRDEILTNSEMKEQYLWGEVREGISYVGLLSVVFIISTVIYITEPPSDIPLLPFNLRAGLEMASGFSFILRFALVLIILLQYARYLFVRVRNDSDLPLKPLYIEKKLRRLRR